MHSTEFILFFSHGGQAAQLTLTHHSTHRGNISLKSLVMSSLFLTRGADAIRDPADVDVQPLDLLLQFLDGRSGILDGATYAVDGVADIELMLQDE